MRISESSCYTLNVKKPKIGLLNIGTEETKGNDLIKSSYQLLKKYSEELDINFIGNVEGREAFLGDVDVVIADGFTGNILLISSPYLSRTAGLMMGRDRKSS